MDGLEAFRQGADLVYLYQDRVCGSQFNPFFQPFGVGYKQIVSHQLNPGAQGFCQHLPAFPVLLMKAVLNGQDGEFLSQAAVVFYHFFRCPLHPLPGHLAFSREKVDVLLFIVQLAGSCVYGNFYLLARAVAA